MELTRPGAVTLRIEPAGYEVTVPPGSSLLQAAEAAGVVLPSSCRNGTCRACLCRLQAGEVFYEIPWPGVSREERLDGDVLPCVAHPRTDVVLIVHRASRG